jgi:hypothetical protein
VHVISPLRKKFSTTTSLQVNVTQASEFYKIWKTDLCCWGKSERQLTRRDFHPSLLTLFFELSSGRRTGAVRSFETRFSISKRKAAHNG